MYTMFSVVGVFTAFGLLGMWRWGWSKGAPFGMALAGLLLGLFGLALAQDSHPRRWEIIRQERLTSVDTTGGVSGVFVWGSGSIGSTTTYRVMIVRKDGSMSAVEIPADESTRIFEDATDGGARYIEYGWVDIRSWRWENWIPRTDSIHARSYELHVPPRSVRVQYNIR